MASRFVSKETKELPLSDGDWIRVKMGLTYGESQQLSSGSFRSARISEDGTPEIGIDYGKMNLRRMQTWIVDWNFKDEKGKNVRLTPAAIASLSESSAREVLTALNKHIAEVTGSRDLTDEEAAEMLGENGGLTKSENELSETIA